MNLQRLSQLQQECSNIARQLKHMSDTDDYYYPLKAKHKKLIDQIRELHHAPTAASKPITTKTEATPAKVTPKTPKPTPTNEATIRSLDFDYYMVPLSQNVAVLIDRVYERWLSYHPFRQAVPAERMQSYRRMIEGIVLNLLYAKLLGLDGVRISRDKARLHRKGFHTRYKPEAYSESLLMILDDLSAMKVLEQILGERWKADFRKVFGIDTSAKYAVQNAKRTVLLPGDEFHMLHATYPVSDVQSIGFNRERQEVIVLKRDESSALVEYEDTDLTRLYRQHIRTINA